MLIMDSHRAHKTAQVKELLRKHKFDLVITKYLQPLDLTVNRSFKCKLKNRYIEAIKQELGEQLVPGTSASRVRLSVLFDDVIGSAKEISHECIRNGFRKMKSSPSMFSL